MRTLIKDVNKEENYSVSGFITNIRNKKNICFIVLKDRSGKLQLTINKEKHINLIDLLDTLTVDSVIKAEGMLVYNDNVKLNQKELIVSDILVYSIACQNPIIAPVGEETNIDMRLDYRFIDLRSDKFNLVFKVQSLFINKFREYLISKDFIEIHSPKLIKTASESGADCFKVKYFDKDAYLAQSPQFYKQMVMASGFERIFETGPVFRAEKFASRKHATEFSGFDVELSYIDSYMDVMKLEEEMLVYALSSIKEVYGKEIKEIFGIDVVVPSKPFPIINLCDLYKDLKELYGYTCSPDEMGDLTTEAERLCEKYSLEKFNSEFLFVIGYSKEQRAFYHMRDEQGNPLGYDLIWKGVEITTGAQREHRIEILEQQAKEKGLFEDVKFYLEFFKYGIPPHGGFGLGIDRITMILFNLGIKEASLIFRGPERLAP